MVLKLPPAQKQVFWTFEKYLFQVFANFSVNKLNPFAENVSQSLQNYLNQNLVIGSFWENDFADALGSKTNVLSVGKEYFSGFCKFFSAEIETMFRKIKPKC